MNQKDLRPASTFAQCYGVKMLAYGPPGQGKTPLVNTAPRPVLLSLEPGMLSMRGSNVPTYQPKNVAEVDDFFNWVFKSNEMKNFDTLAVDSVSHMAEMYLAHEIPRHKNGMAAYGAMARKVYEHLEGIYYLKQLHTYLIAKQCIVNDEMRSYFPGQELNTKVPHLYDVIAHIAKVQIPNMGPEPVLAVRCGGGFGIHCRDRSGNLAHLEPPNLAQIFEKGLRNPA